MHQKDSNIPGKVGTQQFFNGIGLKKDGMNNSKKLSFKDLPQSIYEASNPHEATGQPLSNREMNYSSNRSFNYNPNITNYNHYPIEGQQ